MDRFRGREREFRLVKCDILGNKECPISIQTLIPFVTRRVPQKCAFCRPILQFVLCCRDGVGENKHIQTLLGMSNQVTCGRVFEKGYNGVGPMREVY